MALFIIICWALLELALVVGAVFFIQWILSKLNINIPTNLMQAIWAIIILLAVIWIAQHLHIPSKVF